MSLLDKIKHYAKRTWMFLIDARDWHEDLLEEYSDKWNLTQYTIAWIGFTKGVIVVLLLQWLF